MKPFAIATCLLFTVACGEEETPPQGPLAILGTWADDFGQDHAVTGATWIITGFGETSLFDVVDYDNETRTVIAKNAADNPYNAGLWSRFDWTTHEDELWYCQGVIDGATEADARSPAAAANDHSPDTEGCAGYAWSRLREPLSIRGTYEDIYNGTHVITQTTWTQSYPSDTSLFNITTFDNDAGIVIAQNDASNASLPERWSRIDWVTDSAGLWYCHGTFDGMTEADARAAPAPDRGAPATAGCNGYGWTRLDTP